MTKKILLIITIVSSFLAISCGDKNTDPTITPPTKEEVVKFQGTWIGSIRDELTSQTIALDKINKVSDNVFEFTSEATQDGAKMTFKHKVDFTDNNAPKCTLVWTMEGQGQSYSATYEGTLTKVQ